MTKLVDQVEKYVSTQLVEQLPEHTDYHSIEHTQFVVEKSQEIGINSGLNEEELETITIAAWFHDLGYLRGPRNHEIRSEEMAEEFLKERSVSPEKIKSVLGCIRATKMPQTPTNLLEQVLCDADLSHFGFEGLVQKSMTLYEEMKNLCNMQADHSEWLKMTRDLMVGHSYFTDYAQKTYAAQKDINLKEIEETLSAHS